MRFRQGESNYADHSSNGAPLTEGIYTESGNPFDGKGEVIISCVKELLDISVVGKFINLFHQIPGIIRKKLDVIDSLDRAVKTVGKRKPGYEKNIRSLGI